MSDQGHDPVPPGTPPEPPPADRRLWIIAGILAVIAVIAVGLLLTTQDDDDGDDVVTTDTSVSSSTSASTSSTTEVPETSASSSSTTVDDTSSTTEASGSTTTTGGEGPPVTADPAQCRDVANDTDPEYPAQAVFVAWTRGDTVCAQQLMTAEAFDQLFARDGADAQDEFQGCNEITEGDPHFDCAFTYEGGSTHFRMNFSPTDGWRVFEVYQVAD